MKQRIAACMILGDQYEEEELMRTFDSLRDAGVNRVFINYNGQKLPENIARKEFQALAGSKDGSYWVDVRYNKWEENFGLARTQSFAMVPKDEFDWLLWVDSDDIVVADVSFDKLVENIDPQIVGLFLKYEYAVEPETGQVIVEQWRERLLRASVKWEWHHPIHEVCLGPVGGQFVRRSGVKIVHQRTSGDERGARARNRRIISKAMRENPDVARYVFYFAGETMAEADVTVDPEEKKTMARSAILAFTKFKEMCDEVNDDYFIAQIRIAECFRMAEQWMEAIDADLESIAIYPSWPDGFVGAAKTCMEMGDYTRMLGFADIACKLSKPRTAASIETMNSSFTPLFLRAIANENLGNLVEALKDYQDAREIWNPPNNKLDEKIVEVSELIDKPYVEPEADKQRQVRMNTKQDKSIAFVTNPIPEDWHPELMKINGSGGAELCIMKLAPMFAADGWRVSVFGSPGKYRGVYDDGVEYWDAQELMTHEKFTVFCSSRTPAPFNHQFDSKLKLLWMHDVNVGKSLIEVKDKPDKIIALTPWHKRHLQRVYGLSEDRLCIIPNGIDINRFPRDRSERVDLGSKFIWSSSYDRGLETVLGLWPMIKKRLPEATLDIFYGWNMYNKSIEQWKKFNEGQAAALQQFKDKIEQQMAALGASGIAGITHHGRVDQETLAQYMLDSDIWPYTTLFMETFCITAIEMQAAGVLPITSKLAALTNNIAVPELLIEGWPQNVTYQNQFLNILDSVYSASAEDILQARQEGRRLAEANTWENAYAKWNDLFFEFGVK